MMYNTDPESKRLERLVGILLRRTEASSISWLETDIPGRWLADIPESPLTVELRGPKPPALQGSLGIPAGSVTITVFDNLSDQPVIKHTTSVGNVMYTKGDFLLSILNPIDIDRDLSRLYSLILGIEHQRLESLDALIDELDR